MDPAPRRSLDERMSLFAAAMAAPSAPVDEFALAISVALRPSLDALATASTLDELAARCPSRDREGVIDRLFGSGRFVGDEAHYYGWRNSCLDCVVERGVGIPITLAVLAIAVGRRVGVDLVGIGMPRHFLIGDPGDPHWFVDPFEGRRRLDRDACRQLLASTGMGRWSEHFLDPVPSRAIVVRMLNNLQVACGRAGDRARFGVVMALRGQLSEFADEHDEIAASLAVFN